MRLKILFHDCCFDGAASAALFARFYKERIAPSAEIVFAGMQHTSGDPFGPDAFDADENACVDFRYSPRLTWWFDHHVSAFPTSEARAHFEADRSGRKFYDPKARSCTKFEAGVLSSKFGFDISRYEELISWADLIDGAQFPDAKTAVELEAPALRLMTWLENNKDRAATIKYIEDLQGRSLADIAQEEYVAKPLAPLLARHRECIKVIGKRAVLHGEVVFFDLLEDGIDAPNKFIAYMLFPECLYTVGLTRSSTRVKIGVGYNPWARAPRTHDIATICARYGGGGHPVVGAISLPPGDVANARRIAAEVVAELAGS